MPERTEAPTPHRIAEARRKGQIARSTEINTALLLLAGFWMLGPMAQRLASELAHMTRECFTWPLAQEELTVSGLLHGGLGVGLRFGLLLAPFVGVLMVTGIGANVLQTGLFFSFAGLKPNLSKLNPLSGLQRIVSKQGVIELAKASLKIAVVGLVAYGGIRKAYPELLTLPHHGLAHSWATWQGIALNLGLRIGMTFMGLAVMDYLVQRWQWWQGLRMTREELREEMRQSEGDPQLKGRLRQRQRYLAQSRMMAAVPTADVVVTNPTHYAVALAYDAKTMAAPTVVAKGQRLVAQKIKDLARQHRVPIVENKPLAQALFKSVEVGHEIPGNLYDAAAGVLAYVYSLRSVRRHAARTSTRVHQSA
ncbi:MAG TPA: flagellar biosynthesis protein FlhB [Chloroflexi bacterium]|nr:flagellar biosynthesis protein FlhB [Chloroflexota bacterium]